MRTPGPSQLLILQSWTPGFLTRSNQSRGLVRVKTRPSPAAAGVYGPSCRPRTSWCHISGRWISAASPLRPCHQTVFCSVRVCARSLIYNSEFPPFSCSTTNHLLRDAPRPHKGCQHSSLICFWFPNVTNMSQSKTYLIISASAIRIKGL